MKDILEKAKKDLRANPEKLEGYLNLLLTMGVLSNIESIKLPKVSDELLGRLKEQNIKVIV